MGARAEDGGHEEVSVWVDDDAAVTGGEAGGSWGRVRQAGGGPDEVDPVGIAV